MCHGENICCRNIMRGADLVGSADPTPCGPVMCSCDPMRWGNFMSCVGAAPCGLLLCSSDPIRCGDLLGFGDPMWRALATPSNAANSCIPATSCHAATPCDAAALCKAATLPMRGGDCMSAVHPLPCGDLSVPAIPNDAASPCPVATACAATHAMRRCHARRPPHSDSLMERGTGANAADAGDLVLASPTSRPQAPPASAGCSEGRPTRLPNTHHMTSTRGPGVRRLPGESPDPSS